MENEGKTVKKLTFRCMKQNYINFMTTRK